MHQEKRTVHGLPRGIWVLGFVSLLMDSSSELIHSLLPVFLVGTLGAGPLLLGVIEGIAEATAAVTKLFSGVVSDWLGRRKLLTVLGYGLAALTKPLFPLAGSVGWVLTARFLDRVGKGIRGAPRDALVGDLAPPGLRGAAYGLRQSLDTVGAVAGPLLAILLMALLSGDIRSVLWFAVIPAVLAVVLLIVGVQEPERPAVARSAGPLLRLADLGRLGAAYWSVVALGAALTLARFSEAFLVLKAMETGLALTLVPIVMVVMSVAYAASAYPAGVISDRVGRRGVFGLGLAFLVLADILLATAVGLVPLAAGVVLWGLHMGFTQGLLASMVADRSDARVRGTAFGVFHLVSGAALLVASVLAGWLWQAVGSAATFGAGAALTGIALLGFLALGRGR